MKDDEVEAAANKLTWRVNPGHVFGIGQNPQWFKTVDTVPDTERQMIVNNPIWQGGGAI